MVKYRRLSTEELTHFEKEFIEFLVVNGITADKWEEIKKVDSDRGENNASKIIDQFSDVIFESILRKANYLRKIEPKVIACVQCLEKEFVHIVLESKDDLVDFTKDDLTHYAENPPMGTTTHTYKEDYKTSRELEIYHLLEEGFSIDDGTWFKTLAMSL